ncbi:hypothetical protein PAK_P30100 [Pseudomonas phage PAK_P3]|uniref:Uncharacterized protein n=2 Tax=Nankokuvirus PAKP3 TaxID=1925782 RepID=F2W694_9CAUD|nr:hypothetical protein PAK_P30100 [Pseudomonas phage PAK_P3]ADX32114.1 hypothetical protein P3_CHA0101 [Pseudomonas phage P3_CHA]ADX32299.1 hypothetical protein PAK_P30100 [Pseudomonas phage PAK_P3]
MTTENLTSQEIETSVDEFLKSIDVTLATVPLGERKVEDWVHDLWSVSFIRGDGRRGVLDTEFRTGIGHRKATIPMPVDIRRLAPNILARVAWEKRHIKPVAPKAACILSSLILDCDVGSSTFEEFCGDFGYDTDSRKALDTYMACQETTSKLRRLFSQEEVETIRSLVEHY